MPIQGTLEEAGLPDVLQLLALGRKTGCLAVVDGEMHGEVFLDVGRVSYAAVANRKDRLGEILVRNGRITRDQLKLAADEQSGGNKRQIGQILVDSGRIDRRSIERFVRLQVEEAVYLLFTWKKGEFTFSSERRLPHQSLSVSLDPEGLLLEGARRVDEWSLIQKKVPSFDLVYRLNKNGIKAAPGADLTEEQKRILPLLDGTRDVDGIVDVTGMNEFDVGKALYGLVQAGFAQLVERRTNVRHLDYRELLAYVVREAEFADAQRRKDAGRHIVDCPACTERLRGIHVRRTEGSPPTGTSTVEPLASFEGAVATPPAQAPQSRPPSPPPPRPPQEQPSPAFRAPARTTGFSDRRGRDRRSGYDRRQLERRCERDRRQVVNASWEQLNPEQRIAARRKTERRTGLGREHRGSDGARSVGPSAQVPPTARPPSRGPRATTARILVPGAPRDQEPEPQALPDMDAIRTAATLAQLPAQEELDLLVEEARPPLDEDLETTPVPEDEAPETEEPAQPEESDPANRSSSPKRTAARSKNIEWIVSPDESVEMIRASRSQPGATNGARRSSGKSKAPPSAKPAAAPPARPAATTAPRPGAAPGVKPVAASAAKPVVTAVAKPTPVAVTKPAIGPRPAEAGNRITQPPRPAHAVVAPAPAPASNGEGHRSRPSYAVEVDVWTREVPAPRRAVLPTRKLAFAAAGAGVMLFGYVMYQAGQRGVSAAPGQVAETAAANAYPSAAAAEAPPQGRAPARQAPVTNPVAADPAPQRTPPLPVAVAAAAQPLRPPLETRPVRQEPAQRVALAPVVSVPAPTPTPAAPRGAPPPVAQPVAPSVVAPPPAPAPTVGTVRGTVRDAGGSALGGAQVSVRGTSLSAVTDASGGFEIAGVPDGPVVVQASASGYVAGSLDVRARAGASVAADLTLRSPPTAAAPDREIAAGGWAPVDRAEAATILGGTLGAIQGLSIESIAKSTVGSRPRVRVTQLTEAGERITLSETLAGAAVRSPGPVHLTALRIVPPSEAYPLSTGTASLGNLLITARSSLAPDVLRALLERLGDASGR